MRKPYQEPDTVRVHPIVGRVYNVAYPGIGVIRAEYVRFAAACRSGGHYWEFKVILPDGWTDQQKRWSMQYDARGLPIVPEKGA